MAEYSASDAYRASLQAHYPPEIVGEISKQTGDLNVFEDTDLSPYEWPSDSALPQLLKDRGYATPYHFTAEARQYLIWDSVFVDEVSFANVEAHERHYLLAALWGMTGIAFASVLGLGLQLARLYPRTTGWTELPTLIVLAVGWGVFLNHYNRSTFYHSPLFGIGSEDRSPPPVLNTEYIRRRGAERMNRSRGSGWQGLNDYDLKWKGTDILDTNVLRRRDRRKVKRGELVSGDRPFQPFPENLSWDQFGRLEEEIPQLQELQDSASDSAQIRTDALEKVTRLVASNFAERLNQMGCKPRSAEDYRQEKERQFEWCFFASLDFLASAVRVNPAHAIDYGESIQADARRDTTHAPFAYGALTAGLILFLRFFHPEAKGRVMHRTAMGLGVVGGLMIATSLVSAILYNSSREATDEKVATSPTQLWGLRL